MIPRPLPPNQVVNTNSVTDKLEKKEKKKGKKKNRSTFVGCQKRRGACR